MPVKYFGLDPLSCECYDDLTQADYRISIDGSIQENPRIYTVTVCHIFGENGNPYYFVSGYPNVLKVIHHLENEDQWLKTSQETSQCLSATDRLLQVWRFYYTMNHLLNRPMNGSCNNMVRLLVYDEDFAWVTYIKKEKHYERRLTETLKCENFSMDCSVPAIDVITGPAWAYVLNFFAIYVPEYLDLMDEEFEQCIDYRMKIYLLIPASCDTRQQSDPPNDSDKIRFLTKLATEEKEVTGALRRYEINLYTVNEAPRKDTLVAVQMAKPIGCLWEMGKHRALSGLKLETLHDQAWKFCKLTTKIL